MFYDLENFICWNLGKEYLFHNENLHSKPKLRHYLK